MEKPSRTTIALGILGVVAAGVATYFILLFLSPPESVPPLERRISTDVNSGVLTDPRYTALRAVTALPITAAVIGWPNPFESLDDRHKRASGATTSP